MDSSAPAYHLVRRPVPASAAQPGLDDDQRRVVELHHLKGLPVAEVAEQMGRTRPAVVGLLYRGLKKLRELLQEREEGET